MDFCAKIAQFWPQIDGRKRRNLLKHARIFWPGGRNSGADQNVGKADRRTQRILGGQTEEDGGVEVNLFLIFKNCKF